MDNHCSWHLFDFVCICLYKVDQPIYIYIYIVSIWKRQLVSQSFFGCVRWCYSISLVGPGGSNLTNGRGSTLRGLG